MQAIKRIAAQYLADDDGAVAIEYVVIAAALTLAIVPGFYYVSSAFTLQMQFLISTIDSGS